jgi:molybdate transport system ATP-binding protein
MVRSSHWDSRYVEVRLEAVRLDRSGRRVLDDVSWTIRPGERWVLAGANGAGKTQMLKLVAGSVWPTPGHGARHYLCKGELWRTPDGIQEEIGYVGPERQDKYTRYGWNHTVEQIVATGVHRTDIPLHPVHEAERRRVAAVLRRLRLQTLAHRRFLTLSYGERRLTLLARALASRPRMLLLDELLNGLDEANRERARRWLDGTRRSRMPWVLSTHRVEDVPSSATHALVLDHGRVVYRGEIARAPLTRWLEREVETGPLPPRAAASGGRRATRALVRLTNANVHLDEHVALKDVSLTIHAGDCWVVHGHNGSGKTTLLRTLYGDHGVAVGGRIERAGIQPGVPLQVFKQRVGLVAAHLQADHPQELTACAVVQSGRYASIGLNDAPSVADRVAARRALREFGLSALAARPLRELSYGQLRRVLFARAWVRNPALLLLDEPFSGVDEPTRRDLSERIEARVAGGTAVVMTTHRRSEWPRCASHELELARGEVRYAGPVRERSRSRTPKRPVRRSTRRRRSLR